MPICRSTGPRHAVNLRNMISHALHPALFEKPVRDDSGLTGFY